MENNKFVVSRRKPPIGKSSVLSIRLPNTMVKQLDEVAAKTDRARNELMVMCIEYALANLEITEDGEPQE